MSRRYGTWSLWAPVPRGVRVLCILRQGTKRRRLCGKIPGHAGLFQGSSGCLRGRCVLGFREKDVMTYADVWVGFNYFNQKLRTTMRPRKAKPMLQKRSPLPPSMPLLRHHFPLMITIPLRPRPQFSWNLRHHMRALRLARRTHRTRPAART